MDRFVIDTTGADTDVEREAFLWLLGEARAANEDAAVVVPTVSAIENLGRALGEDTAVAARKDRSFTVDGITVRVFAPRAQPGTFAGPLLVLWADSSMVERAELLRPRAVCATGWIEGGLDQWKRAWNPVDSRSGEAEKSEDEPPPVIDGLLISLSHPSGAGDVLHPSDKRRAVTAFKALRMLDISFDPVQVRVLATQKGWAPDAADRLHAIAQKTAEGRAVQGGDKLTKAKARELVARLETVAGR